MQPVAVAHHRLPVPLLPFGFELQFLFVDDEVVLCVVGVTPVQVFHLEAVPELFSLLLVELDITDRNLEEESDDVDLLVLDVGVDRDHKDTDDEDVEESESEECNLQVLSNAGSVLQVE